MEEGAILVASDRRATAAALSPYAARAGCIGPIVSMRGEVATGPFAENGCEYRGVNTEGVNTEGVKRAFTGRSLASSHAARSRDIST